MSSKFVLILSRTSAHGILSMPHYHVRLSALHNQVAIQSSSVGAMSLISVNILHCLLDRLYQYWLLLISKDTRLCPIQYTIRMQLSRKTP